MISEVVSGIEVSYEAFESYFDGLKEFADDSSVAPPMSYDTSFLGSLSSDIFESTMLSVGQSTPSYSESAAMDALLLVTSANRDLEIRSMTRKDYYADAQNYYLAESEYHTFRKDLNTQYLTASTPKQRV